MPELPEVETTRRALGRLIAGRRIVAVHVHERRLRYALPRGLEKLLVSERITAIERRGKYLFLVCRDGTLLIHLGMSGSLRVVACEHALRRHDHVELVFDHGRCLRFHDPRRFGLILWVRGDVSRHRLIRNLGPEPFADEFNGGYLHKLAHGRRQSIKTFLMDSRIVAGLGNIYVNEALFRSGIHPRRSIGRISLLRYNRLVMTIREVLDEAVRQGGTTLRDFTSGTGRAGYFAIHLQVYGRDRQPCLHCGTLIRKIRQAQRSSYYCTRCQK